MRKPNHTVEIQNGNDVVVLVNNKPHCKINSYHLSSKSDLSTSNTRGNKASFGDKCYGGLIIYSLGNLIIRKSLRKSQIMPGYVFLVDSDRIKAERLPTDEGKIHGTMCRLLLGYQPSQILRAGGILSGFSVQYGKLKFTSRFQLLYLILMSINENICLCLDLYQ